MRGWLVLVFVVACKKSEQAAPPPPAPPESKPAPAAGELVQPGTVRTRVVDEGYAVVVPKGGDVDATVKGSRAPRRRQTSR